MKDFTIYKMMKFVSMVEGLYYPYRAMYGMCLVCRGGQTGYATFGKMCALLTSWKRGLACFKQVIVHHQQVISVHAAYSILSRICGCLAANTVWLEHRVCVFPRASAASHGCTAACWLIVPPALGVPTLATRCPRAYRRVPHSSGGSWNLWAGNRTGNFV
jgi:hypothetical protein